ncbi:MAG: class IV adenylate cyclase [Nanoarchaeota archaeon]
MHETEAKAKVKTHERLEEKLKEMGFEYIGETNEHNSMYDICGFLKRHDRALRMRKDETGCCITYKGKQEDSSYKHRREIEFGIPLFLYSALYAIIPNSLKYEKKRLTYQRDKCKVCLDDVKKLGKFVEIEGQEEEIKLIIEQLGIKETTKESYPQMIARLGHQPDKE